MAEPLTLMKTGLESRESGPRCFQGILNMEAVLAICTIQSPPNLITLLISASNYIISGSTGFEAAKACAVIDDAPRVPDQGHTGDTSQLLTTPPVSVKTGKKAMTDCCFCFPRLCEILYYHFRKPITLCQHCYQNI